MNDLRDKIADAVRRSYNHGRNEINAASENTTVEIEANAIIEIMREALLTPDVFRALVVSLDSKALEDGYIQFDVAAGMNAALDTAGATRRKQTIEDFIEGH